MTLLDAHDVRLQQRADLLGDVPTGLLIGAWRSAERGETFAVEDPATGQELIRIADASPSDGLAALDAAVEAADAWAARSPRERSDVLRRVYEAILDRVDDLALLITLEMGKPLDEARGEVIYAADYIRWYAEEAVRLNGRHTASPDGRSRIVTGPQPVGPCLLITPWNFPLAMATRKIAPALAAGCTVVLKPAELTPLTSLYAAQLMLDAGVSAGVVNVVTTTDPAGVCGTLMADPRLRKVSFTGSTAVGRILVEQSAQQLVRTSMELGGNAPLIVFDDADLDRAVEGAVTAKLRNGGESCVAANRVLVQDGIAEAFVAALTEALSAVEMGPGTQPGVRLGPLIDDRAVAKCTDLVKDAVASGATVLVGGEAPSAPGYFFPATVLDNVPPMARILSEEVFGPVAPIVRFSSEDEAVALADDTPYGLAAYVFTENVDRALRVADRIEAGMVGVNQGLVSNVAAPFGGIKHSGVGREGGPEGIEEYLETKYVAINNKH
jgi:succinate-semialdehyde dehydrogenase / glutarate-semialdehyde dehydrogenase